MRKKSRKLRVLISRYVLHKVDTIVNEITDHAHREIKDMRPKQHGHTSTTGLQV